MLEGELKTAVINAKKVEGNVDSLRQIQIQNNKNNKVLQAEVRNLKGRVATSTKKLNNMAAEQKKKADEAKASGNVNSEELANSFKQFYSDVYYIRAKRLVVEYQGEREVIEPYPLSGTGFLLSDGRFITARHLIEPWFYYETNDPDPLEIILNALVNNGGTAWLEYEAFSTGDRKLEFNSKQFIVNNKADEGVEMENPEGGDPLMVTHAGYDDGMDWAYYKAGRSGSISSDPGISRNLPNGADIRILGFPFGLGTENEIEPIQSSVKTASGNLQNNVIVVNGSGIEPGNSGGPAFYYSNGQYKVIGIVSVKVNSIGFLVPISNLR